jgi:ribose transport system ATP-binding protein
MEPMLPREQDTTPALDVVGLSKSFTRTRALAGVSLSIAPGEVHALLGQNGSGKSTLIKILSGYHAPDPGGSVRVGGEELHFNAPVQSYRLGCRVVQQDLGLVSSLSVLDNMALTSGFPTVAGTIRPRASAAQAREDLRKLNLDIDPRTPVAKLTASQRTGVAVARALRDDPSYPPRLLILDEPTATLPVDEVDSLLEMVESMASTGVGVLYVTHHLGEVFRVGHRLSVLRDGVVVGSGPVGAFDQQSLVQLLVGEELAEEESAARAERAARHVDQPPVLEVRDLSGGAVRGVSLSVSPGEIVGVAGLRGSGRDDLLPRVFGCLPRTDGNVSVAGVELKEGRPDLAIGRGVAYLAPDRKTSGGVMNMTARENLTMPDLTPFWKGLRLRRKLETQRTMEWFKRLGVRPAGAYEQALSIFSGGNQQKILFGKWLSQRPSVFLLDEPTQGVDVGAKADLHRELRTAAAEGAAVVISSSDLEELADLCDRVLVLVDGRIAAELSGGALTEAAITREFMPAAEVPV